MKYYINMEIFYQYFCLCKHTHPQTTGFVIGAGRIGNKKTGTHSTRINSHECCSDNNNLNVTRSFQIKLIALLFISHYQGNSSALI